ncbi:MAG: CcmD family protein [Chloroflexota bacterium]
MIPYEVSIKYMLAGYIVILLVLAAYLASLFVRWKKLKRELKTLQEIEKK